MKKLSSDFVRSVRWEENRDSVSRFIRSGALSGPAFTYFHGFKLVVHDCDPVEHCSSQAQPGEIVEIQEGGFPVVMTGSGPLRLRRWFLDVAGDQCNHFQEFVRVTGFFPPYQLTAVPFNSNQGGTEWELAVNRWRLRDEKLDIGTKKACEESVEQVDFIGRPKESPEDTRIEYLDDLSKKNHGFATSLVERLGLPRGSKVLDIGCGNGWACQIFHNLGMDVYGLDLLPSSILAARTLVPNGTFFECDVLDLPRLTRLKGHFDLVFCRDLGIAQKIVDWNDPSWIRVGAAMVELLNSRGAVYWIQMTNRTDMVGIDGFSNASIDNLLRYFQRFSHVVCVHQFGYVSLLLTSNPPAPPLVKSLRKADAKLHFNVYQWARPLLETREKTQPLTHFDALLTRLSPLRLVAASLRRRLTTLLEPKNPWFFPVRTPQRMKPEPDWLSAPALVSLVKVLFARLSQLHLISTNQRRKGIVVVGTGRLSALSFHIMGRLGFDVKCFATLSKSSGIWMKTPVLPLAEALDLEPGVIIFPLVTDKNSCSGVSWHDKDLAYESLCLFDDRDTDFAERVATAPDEIYLISGDQDEYFTAREMAWFEALSIEEYPDKLKQIPLQNSEFGEWKGALPQGWSVGGENGVVRRTEGFSCSGPTAAELSSDGSVSFLVQRIANVRWGRNRRLTLGCWVRTDQPAIARVQLTDQSADVASEWHAGDGTWRFLSVTKKIPLRASFVDVNLQVTAPGEALFVQPVLYSS